MKKDMPNPGGRRDYRDPGADALKRAAARAGDVLFGNVPGVAEFWSWIRGHLEPAVEEEVRSIALQLNATKVRVSEDALARRCHQVLLILAKTVQEEKREYLRNALLNYAAGRVKEDDATLLLPLVEALSLRHVVILQDLVRLCPGIPNSFPDEKLLRQGAVWNRLKDNWPSDGSGHDGRIFESIAEDLRSRGLLQRDTSIWGHGEAPHMYPSILAKRLLDFVAYPAPDAANG